MGHILEKCTLASIMLDCTMQSKQSLVILKLDFAKACDKISWDFGLMLVKVAQKKMLHQPKSISFIF
jgi:hypothetical protein